MRPERGSALRDLLTACMALALLPVAGCDRPGPTREEAAAEPPLGLEFEPPAPGTYELPPIQRAADGVVVAADGSEHRLSDYMGDRYVLLSFIYTHCANGRGCPFATAVFQMIRRRLQDEPEVAERVRLVTLSFDPERDTAAAMQHYGRSVEGDGQVEERGDRSWVFLTTQSRAELQPILEAYGQYIVPESDESGDPTGDFSHVLKVFLIDREGQVRNIYSSGFLHPVVAINDVKTLMMEEAGS